MRERGILTATLSMDSAKQETPLFMLCCHIVYYYAIIYFLTMDKIWQKTYIGCGRTQSSDLCQPR